MRSVTTAGNLKGKYVLLRSSLNIPLHNNEVESFFRLEQAIPTMRFLAEQGARTIVVSHIGREPVETLQPVHTALSKYLPVHWGGTLTSDAFAEHRRLLGEGELLLAENLRQDEREKANDESFVELLASQAEVYVNDAFAVAHRQHASTYGVAKRLPAYAGLTFMQEVAELQKMLDPAAPALFLLGGAKFDTKMPLVEKYLKIYEHVFIGGALANDLFKARGLEVGRSKVSDISLAEAPFLHDPKLLLPLDVIVDGPAGRQVKQPEQVTAEEQILDCGPKTIDMLAGYIENARTILWNGPFGAYERGYTQSTEITARHIAASPAISVVGGGDTVAAIEHLDINDLFGFVSTAGGAMLMFLEYGMTPVVKVLSDES